MSATAASAILEAARRAAHLSVEELWIAYFSLGGTGTKSQLTAYLSGTAVPSNAQYNVIAQALNEQFADNGADHPVPYADDIAW